MNNETSLAAAPVERTFNGRKVTLTPIGHGYHVYCEPQGTDREMETEIIAKTLAEAEIEARKFIFAETLNHALVTGINELGSKYGVPMREFERLTDMVYELRFLASPYSDDGTSPWLDTFERERYYHENLVPEAVTPNP